MKKLLIWSLVALLLALIGGASAYLWWSQSQSSNKAPAKTPAVELDPRVYKYTSLEKVIVMLRGTNQAASNHYLALDLVFKVEEAQAKQLKEHLPLLRSIAVRKLSPLTREQASAMTIEQFTQALNTAFVEAYQHDRQAKPFVTALISKLIIE